MTNTIRDFGDVLFDLDKKTMIIVDGSIGTYDYRNIQRALVLNEKAKTRGKTSPFTSCLPHGPGIPAILTDPYIYVGVKVVLENGDVLAIYTSKEKTQIGTDPYKVDREKAKEIEAFLRKIIHKYQPAVDS